MAKEKSVVDGAIISCTSGSVPGIFIANPTGKCKAGGKVMGVVTDNVPVTNIPTFGTCSVTGATCAPAITAPWVPGATKVTCEGMAGIKNGDTLICTVGGSISVDDDGQVKVDIE